MTSTYRWLITEDHINGDEFRVGTEGPSGCNFQTLLNHKFRMYDDDDILYYEGLIGGEYSGFEPLDEFGAPDAGCTRIDYLNEERWETL